LKKSINVLFCSSEVAPFEKTGGLADVAGSLPIALAKIGVQLRVVMPKYRGIDIQEKKIADGVRVHFIENESYFNRAGLYGNDRGDYPDNLERFSFFCHEALNLAKTIGFRPDIVHAHDWQTALLPVLLKTTLANDTFYAHTKSVLTVHNIAYQGHFSQKQFGHLGLDPSLFSMDGFEFYGKINLLKAGLLFADFLTTVSPTYAEEIKTKEFGFGLEGVVKKREKNLRGILNGIDQEIWNPAKDPRIAKMYGVTSIEGKKICKQALQKKCGFEVNVDIPLFGMVTRLAEQKGLDLVAEICDALVTKPAQFVILGDGEAVYHTTFRNIAARHPKNAAAFLRFDADQAHAIYAGADFFLMPSYFEPCGLGQMIGMRYGTLPVVRRVGGLADTVIDADLHPEKGNGFVFVERTPEKLLSVIKRALKAFKDKPRMQAFRKTAMKSDFSWSKSAEKYAQLYRKILKEVVV
jgi:starch synthase